MRAMKRLMLLSMMILTPVIASAQTETGFECGLGRDQGRCSNPITYVPATLSV